MSPTGRPGSDAAPHASVRPRARTVRRSAPFVVLGGLVLAGAGVAALRSTGVDVLPPCPIHALTGLDCPGCGATRATMALLRGDATAAVSHNALFVLGLLPLLVIGWFAWARAALRGRALTLRLRSWTVPAAVAVALAFAVVRNLPGVPFLDAVA